MKKFATILCILLLLVPSVCFAMGSSPTVENQIKSYPSVPFKLAENTADWTKIIERLKEVETENYVLLEALQIDIKKPYEKVKWELMSYVTSKDEPFIFIIDLSKQEAIIKQEVSVKDGAIITDFTNLNSGIYYILFYIRKGA